MILSFFIGYFKETSAHGFKYIAGGNAILERLIWISLVTASFTIAGIMIYSNLEDVHSNPIVTSIKTIPVQEIPFPAVTISGVKEEFPNRFITQVLNGIEFDCLNSDERCVERTSKVRKDFQPFIRRAIKVKWEETDKEIKRFWKNVERPKVENNFKQFICQTKHELIRRHFLDFTRAYEIGNKTFREEMEKGLLEVGTGTFRYPEPLVDAKMEEFVSAILHPDKRGESSVSLDVCHKGLESRNISLDTKFRIAAFAFALARDDVHELPLGQLLAVNTNPNKFLFDYDDTEAKVGLEILWSIMKQLSLFYGNDLPMGEVCNYLSFSEEPMIQAEDTDCDTNYDILEKSFFDYDLTSFCTSGTEECCALESKMAENKLTVRNMAKYLLAPTTRLIRHEVERAEIEMAVSNTGYNVKVSDSYHLNPVIFGCKFGHARVTYLCDLFAQTFTTGGIGYGFNNAFFPNILEMYDQNHSPRNESSTKGIKANGQAYSLEFYLNHIPYKHFRSVPYLAINNPRIIPDIRNEALELEPGMVYTVVLTPSKIETDEAGMSLAPKDRDCLSPKDRHDLKFFSEYTQSACLFECQLARAERLCNCTLWDYPDMDESLPLCHYLLADTCFEVSLKTPVDPDACGCPSDCHSIQYGQTISTQKINTNNLCDRDDQMRENLFNGVGLPTLMPNDFVTMKGLDMNLLPKRHYDCLAMFANVTIVKVHVGPKTSNLIVRTRRVTFSGQVANLGGLIGLFSGMSILSLAEAVYWFVRALTRCMRYKKNAKMENLKSKNVINY